jgi:hypothetical protein
LNGDWDDARLNAAYRAAFDSLPPSNLAARIGAQLLPRMPARWHLPGLAGPAMAAIVIAAVLISNGWIVGPAARASFGPTATISGTNLGTSSPTSTGASLAWPFPDHVSTTAGELVPVSVADAARIRSSSETPSEIAVAGWQSNATDFRFCTLAFRGLVGQLENQCVYNRWLAEQPEPTSAWYDPPVEPAIRLAGDAIWQPPNLLKWGESGVIHFRGASVAVVVVGHFHDPASAQCRPANAQLCSNTFVVDDIPWVLSTAGHRVVPNPDVVPMSVADAIGVRDSGASSEVAVGGWFSFYPVPCAAIPDAHPPLESCIANVTWLMSKPEDLQELASDGSGSIHPPAGPAISLVFDQATVPALGTLPEQMVLVGHFNDARSSECPAGARRAACSARFVIDEFLVVGTGAPSPSTSATP